MNVTVKRTIKATPEAVYDVWLDTKSPGGPWFDAEPRIIDVKVGGLFYHVVDHKGRRHPHYGRFITLDRARTIEYAWLSESTHGIETLVTIELRPTPEGCDFTLVHSKLPDDEFGRDHQRGWDFITDAVLKRFAR
jgi:uncharacterized protein YndB with AHSA1/START domain